ncbi:MAG: pirin family protein [Myxococcota bacterium]
MQSIIETIPPRIHPLGGVSVRRYLPATGRQMVGPFIFMDYGGPFKIPHTMAKGVPEHPHAGLATFTYLMDGEMNHRDSAGYAATIRAGDIALMTAGRGITHEELPSRAEVKDTHRAHFLQLWIALPDEAEETEPTFELHRQADLPVVRTDGALVRVAMGSGWGETAPTTCYTTTIFADMQLEPGAAVPMDVAADEVALILLDGDGDLGDGPIEAHSLHLLAPQSMTLRSTGGCRAIVLGGGHFASPRWIGGSFVASSVDKLQRWMYDSAIGRWPQIKR